MAAAELDEAVPDPHAVAIVGAALIGGVASIVVGFTMFLFLATPMNYPLFVRAE